MQETGKYILLAGAGLLVIGAIVYFFGDKLSFLGRLPGDIRIERENVKIYFPITTMILVSIVLSLVFWVIRKLG